MDFENTKNLYIEGDNLDALKLLQETYLGKVKMIYIDPPYNTGNDFIYEDDFTAGREAYQRGAGEKDEQGNRMMDEERWKQNSISNGRFHSDWLSMIYPRLRLARNLLSDDGVTFISIDDGEVANLRKACDEIFGESNFVANLIWQSRTSISDDHEISLNHNHTIIYAKSRQCLEFHGEPLDESEYRNPDGDTRGPWKLVPLDANKPGGDTLYGIVNPRTGEEHFPPNGRSWAINRIELKKLQVDGRIKFGMSDDSSPKKKLFLNERKQRGDSKTPSSILLDAGTTKAGTAEVLDLFNEKKIFSYPKPTHLLRRLLQFGCSVKRENIILDFFSGSATTAHAVMQLNAEDGGKRRHIMVQLPEPCDAKSEAFKAGFKTIAEIGKERIRRAGKKILAEWHAKEQSAELDLLHPPSTISDPPSPPDIGFRVLKVDSSNFADILRTPEELNQKELALHTQHIKPDRSPEDLLFHVLVDWGVDLALPVVEETLCGKRVFFVDGNALAACFDNGIDDALIKAIAACKPQRAVFRDEAYGDDSARINVAQLFALLSPNTELKSL
ncbi:MAG: site-specific DNA-methyltransferase [Verrucomicrobiota bacterium]